MKSTLTARLWPLYVAAFFQALNFWFAIEKIFMRSIGFNDAAIGLAAALFTAVIILLEAPSGILADRWSRKGVLIIASFAMLVTSVLCGLSDSVLWYTLSIMFVGVYFAMYSGTYEAIIYDTVVEQKTDSDNYQAAYGKFQIISSVSLITGSVIGAIISASLSPQAAYFMTIPAMLISIIALICFKEPKLHKLLDERTIRAQIRDTISMIAGKSAARALVLTIVLLTASTALLFQYAQVWYLALSVPVVLFGLLYGSLNASLGLAGFIGQFAVDKRKLIILSFTLLIISSVGLTISNLPTVITAQILLQTFLIALTVIMTKRFHDTIPATNRAGAGSAIGTLSQALAIILYILFGLISNTFSIYVAGGLFIGLAVLALLTVYRGRLFEINSN